MTRDSGSRWIDIASRALFDIRSPAFSTASSALRAFQAWLGDGVVAARGPRASVALELRLARELREASGATAARSIVDDARSSEASDVLLPKALVLLALRLAEEGQHLAAIEALVEVGPSPSRSTQRCEAWRGAFTARSS